LYLFIYFTLFSIFVFIFDGFLNACKRIYGAEQSDRLSAKLAQLTRHYSVQVLVA